MPLLASAVKGVRQILAPLDDQAMTASEHGPPVDDKENGEDEEDVIERVVEDVRDEIRQGHVTDDVSHVLEERLHEVVVDLRPERVDDLAEDIENDVST